MTQALFPEMLRFPYTSKAAPPETLKTVRWIIHVELEEMTVVEEERENALLFPLYASSFESSMVHLLL